MKKTIIGAFALAIIIVGVHFCATNPETQPVSVQPEQIQTTPKQNPRNEIKTVSSTTHQTERELNQFGLTLNGAKSINVK